MTVEDMRHAVEDARQTVRLDNLPGVIRYHFLAILLRAVENSPFRQLVNLPGVIILFSLILHLSGRESLPAGYV